MKPYLFLISLLIGLFFVNIPVFADTPLNHTITFVNYCDEDIYVVHLLGPQGYFPPPDNTMVCSACSCSPSHDPCPTTNCSKTKCCDGSTPPICKNCSQGIELFDQGGFKLNATNGTKTYSNIGPWWEGAMWGRTGCTPLNASDPHSPLNCTGAPTNDVNSRYDSVSPGGSGGKPPASKFEWTFDGGLVNPKAMDVYDLSLVDGFNAPVMLYPVKGSFDPKNPWTDKNLSPYYANASGSAVDLNDKFKHGAGKLSRTKIPIMKNGTIYALHSACTYYQKLCDSSSPDCNRTLQDMACCNPPYGSNKSAPIHCDWDKYLPDDVNTKDFFKKYYPGVYSYAYDDGESTYQVRGLATRNTEYICQFCRNDSQSFHSVSRPYGEVSSVWSSEATPGGCSWQHPLGGFELDYGESIEPTSDGGYIIAGYTYSADGDVQDKIAGMDQSDFWVVKLAANGNIEWKKCLGGSDEDEAFDIIQTSDGGYLVVGYTASDDIPGSGKKGGSDNSDFFAVKLTADGSISWNKCYGGTDSEIARHVLQTSDGGYIIAGYTYSNDGDVTGKIAGSMNADYWVIKIDGSGTLTWATCYGGSSDDYGEAVSLLSDGYLVTGNSMSTDGQAIGNHGLNDFLVMKIDVSGNVVWSTCYGGSFDDAGYDIISLPDGGGIAFGLTGSSDGQVTGNHGEDDFWAVRFDNAGSMFWSKCYGGSDTDQGFEIVQSPVTGRFLMVGTSQSSDGDLSGNYGLIDIWVIETDMNGSLIWQKNIGGSQNDYGNSLGLPSFGNVTVAGYTDSSDHDVIGQHGLYDMWVAKVPIDSIYFPVNATADPWTIVYPAGITEYPEMSDPLYVTQGKPGAILEDVQVDEVSQGNISHYTFTDINDTHSIEATGTPIPGQIHVKFTISPQSGSVPLTVEFNDTSIGGPSSWYWQLGDGATSPLQNLTHSYTIPGTYTVSLRAYNSQTGGYGVCNDCIQVNS
jgi:hypothetical protein